MSAPGEYGGVSTSDETAQSAFSSTRARLQAHAAKLKKSILEGTVELATLGTIGAVLMVFVSGGLQSIASCLSFTLAQGGRGCTLHGDYWLLANKADLAVYSIVSVPHQRGSSLGFTLRPNRFSLVFPG